MAYHKLCFLAGAAVAVLVVSLADAHSVAKRDVQDDIKDGIDDLTTRDQVCVTDDQCTDIIEYCDNQSISTTAFRCKFQTWFVVAVIAVPVLLLLTLLFSCCCCPCCCLYAMCRKR